jgi:hypothetical protein
MAAGIRTAALVNSAHPDKCLWRDAVIAKLKFGNNKNNKKSNIKTPFLIHIF